jgi:hypothetical protein
MTAPDLDALIERLNGYNPPDRTVPEQRQMAQDIADAAAALAELREENARLHDWYNIAIVEMRQRAERAEAEVARLTWYKSRADDLVRYLSMKPPQITAVEAVIAELTLRAARSKP